MATKRPPDPRGGFVRIHWEIIDSMAWRALSWADQGLYVVMKRKLNGSNNGNIEATLATLRHAGVTSSATLSKSLRALMAMGLIARTREGHLSQGKKVCNLFRFTDESMFEFPKQELKAMPATNGWRKFKTIKEATDALAAAHLDAKTGVKRAPNARQKKREINSIFELTRFKN